MKLILDKPDKPKHFLDVDWKLIVDGISSINGTTMSFCILENEKEEYVQVAGNSSHVTIEFRTTLNNKMRHYRFGIGEIKSALKTSWSFIHSGVGTIRLHTDEVLSKKDALTLFENFFNRNEFDNIYKKRNITKELT